MSEGRRRVLCLLPFVPRLDASHGGARASAMLVDALARRAEVGVICIRARGEPSTDREVRVACAFVDEMPRDALPLGARLVREGRARLAAFGGVPAWAARWRLPSFAAQAATRMREWQPHVVQIESQVMAQYAAALRDGHVPMVMTQQEPATAAARERARIASGFAAMRAALEARGWERYERAIYGDLDAVATFSERDRREVSALAGSHVELARIALGTVVPFAPLDPCGRIEGRLLFVGNFDHPPNVDAAEWLVRDIFPLVRDSVPRATLQIVGASPPPALRELAAEAVTVTGAVETVTPHLEDAAVVVAPLRLGGGTRVKVLEALAAGKAIVATPRALEGIGIEPGLHAVAAEGAAEMAREIAALLGDRARREALGAAARAWALSRLEYDRVGVEYMALYQRLLGRGR